MDKNLFSATPKNTLAPSVPRWRMPAAAQNVTPKNGYGTPGERRQDG